MSWDYVVARRAGVGAAAASEDMVVWAVTAAVKVEDWEAVNGILGDLYQI